MTWQELERKRVSRSGAPQEIPTKTRSRNVQAAMAARQLEQARAANALSEIGFNLAWKPGQAELQFRELQAEPLTYADETAVR